MKHCLEILANKYPQLYMPIQAGMRQSEEYKNVVLRGMKADRTLSFSLNPEDSLEKIETPGGFVEVLTLRDRDDFVHAVQCLGNRCEPEEVPASMGASVIFGLNNWEKVRAGEDDYKDSLIILSSGNYSNVDSDAVSKCLGQKIAEDEWIEKSITIRKYHELTHFVMRKLYPDDKDALRDELIADLAGLIEAFAYYDDDLARLFLGLENEEYRNGGRLENYEGGTSENIPKVNVMIERYKDITKDCHTAADVWKDIEEYM